MRHAFPARSTPVDPGEGLRVEASLRCGSCGRFGAFDLGDRHLCEECYQAPGSCCPEFGKDDLSTTEG